MLEQALVPLCGPDLAVVGAGRTDAGVHALGQVAHFDTDRPRSPQVYLRAINATTPPEVTVLQASRVPFDFHARHSARWREYRYRISQRPSPPALERGRVWHHPVPLMLDGMIRAAALLEGTHDFSAFRAASCQAASPVRTLRQALVTAHGDEIWITLVGNAFLHHMVRNVVGSLVRVGLGRWSVEDFRTVFESRDRTRAAATAPSQGLYLVRVIY